MTRFAATIVAPLAALCSAVPGYAQSEPIFVPGTGDPTISVAPAAPALPVRQNQLNCASLPEASERLSALYGKRAVALASPELADAVVPEPQVSTPAQRLDRSLLDLALASYRQHHCRGGIGQGPADMIVVDFAKPSSQPRLYAVNLLSGKGIDTPIKVAHGIGSDPNDDGIADRFSNVQDSLMSSLGAARGAELYHGSNGLSLRLDGLESSNYAMRSRDIVAHSYQPARRRYFNASLLADRGGKPGTSEGCIVVAPEYRDWLFALLGNGGFMFAGLGGDRAKEMNGPPAPPPAMTGEIVFVSGTGG
jgi:hypothetical protein